MVTKKVSGAADGSTVDTTITDETTKVVEFGSDAWGTWAQSVQERLAALEGQQLTVSAEQLDMFRDELKGMSERIDAKEHKAANTKERGDTGGRLGMIEQMLGIGAVPETVAAAENAETTMNQDVSTEAKEGTVVGQ